MQAQKGREEVTKVDNGDFSAGQLAFVILVTVILVVALLLAMSTDAMACVAVL